MVPHNALIKYDSGQAPTSRGRPAPPRINLFHKERGMTVLGVIFDFFDTISI